MTIENCLRLAEVCRKYDDEVGAKAYEERAKRKKNKRNRLIAIEEAITKKLESDEEVRLQKVEEELGIKKEEKPEEPKEIKKETKDGKKSKR